MIRKHFFCAKSREDYKKVYLPLFEKVKDNYASVNDFEQDFFFEHIKTLLKVPEDVFDSVIVGETPIPGLRLDFNFGLRMDIPEGNFRVTISDADSGQLFFDKHLSDCRILSVEQYFIRWEVNVYLDGERVFSHTLNLEGQTVMLAFMTVIGMGDLIAFLPYVREFERIHRCKVKLYMADYLREFTAHFYPDLEQADTIDFNAYATYYPIMCMSDFLITPVDARNMPLERMGMSILGLNHLPPKLTFKPTAPRFFSEPYVCIGVQASINRKGWLYPGGWDIVVDYLKSLGYRVFCIDKNSEVTNDEMTIRMPSGAEDFTGDFSIMDRANMLYHAEFFIGLSSGLAWVANLVNCPVVMICGFSQDWFEFYTPYRVANRFVCNGCFNDIRTSFIVKLCPYHNRTARELECQKKISPQQVIDAINCLIIDKNLIPPRLNPPRPLRSLDFYLRRAARMGKELAEDSE